MTISRGQMPRQMYGLGSLVKSVTKGVKGILKSDLGKAALLAGGAYALGGGSFFGKSLPFLKQNSGFAFGNIPTNLGGILGLKSGKDAMLGNMLKVGTAGTLLGGALSGYEDQGGTTGGERNVDALRTRLTKAYTELGYDQNEIPALVEADLAEYTSGAGGYANGGRIGYAFGDVVDQASGIMGLPQRTNQAGVKELDLRNSGGFIPPVGVKEKADDIPAMLSNNEFVFTADAVRNAGNGDVNKGAQLMYDMMKKLEKGGRV